MEDTSSYLSLISEAVRRILLDMVVRGHGDRLIGRWSRDAQVQQFLEQVPYMLDRINQLHLACARPELESGAPGHHYYHRHQQQSGCLGQSSLGDLVSLIGEQHHWLVRTRDALGLTPLHKAVLFNNRPVVEYILDRYPEERAASGWRAAGGGQQARAGPPTGRLIDAQDKYGRTALHYAAALAQPAGHQIYQFLVAKGASQSITDFRGKAAPYYLRHARQLRAKSVIHLANKLNASYQANVLSKTLRLSGARRPAGAEQEADLSQLDGLLDGDRCNMQPQSIRESMSVSCNDLRPAELEQPPLPRTRSELEGSQLASEPEESQPGKQVGGELEEASLAEQVTIEQNPTEEGELASQHAQAESPEGNPLTRDASSPSLSADSQQGAERRAELRRLVADRCQRQLVDQRTRTLIRRSLNEGAVQQVNERLAEGYGQFMVEEAAVSCWNQQCKRYILNVIPSLLERLDRLHERIAADQPAEVAGLLSKEPVLARIRRPYKRAAMAALHVAVQLDRRAIVRHLVADFPELLSWPDSQGATCLHWAARCLKRDKLYRWLLEHHGPRLEQVRDSRGKSAADYRQQAIRMSSFGGASGRQRPAPSSAREMMRRSQEASNKLQLQGTKVHLTSRHRANATKGAGSSDCNDSSTSTQLAGSVVDIDVQPAPPDDPDGSTQAATSRPSTRKSSSAVCFTQRSIDERDLAARRRLSDTGRPSEEEAGPPQPVEPPRLERENSCPNLLDEMVQLECEPGAGGGRDSPLATPCLPVSRPQSASTGGRLDGIIVEALRSADLKRLEHIVLAGCGHRLQRVFLASEPEGEPSDELAGFLQDQVPRDMRTIALIHDTLHQCCSTASSPAFDPNRPFHKLCNLLARNRLILSRDRHGASPLHVALLRSDRRLADYLIRRHPEAASAPDMESRNALHYAAIALAAREAHGDFRLLGAEPHGFWPVDRTCRLLYENLCLRYTDLLSASDGLGLTCADYLARSSEREHVALGSQPAAGQSIASCCPEYAKLLDRYQYRIQAAAAAPQKPSEQTRERKRLARRAESYEVATSSPQVGGRGRRRTADDLFGSADLVTAPDDWATASAKQVAPRPTVGSAAGFTGAPTSACEAAGSRARSKTQQASGARAHKPRALLDGLDPNHRGHAHRRKQRGRRSHSSAGHSIVGGVIVPTIIHNDKMDEIETYDIIYRQPASSRASSSSSSSEPERRPPEGPGRHASSDTDSELQFGEEEEDDDDEQVERLSDEFEDRVRNEKSELRAKVDQIMDEIRLSSKSGKSAHLLGSSPARGRPDKADPRLSSVSSAGSLGSKSLSCSLGTSTSRSSLSSSCSSASSTCSAGSLSSGGPAPASQRPPATPPATHSGRQPVSKNTYGQTYLHFIGSRAQNGAILYKVLEHGSHLIGERDVFYRTARDVAVQFSLPNNVQTFDKYVIDLFVAANTQLLRHLLIQGYSPLIHVADPDGNDVMLILKLLRLDRMVHFLLQMADFQRWRDELHTFIRHGYSAGVSELIRRHRDLVQAKSSHARTSLHLAVLFDRPSMVEELLEADQAAVHATDNMGRTPLHYLYGAHLSHADQIRAKLLECGSRQDLRDVKMRTPKYYYIFKREIEDIKRMELELD